MVLCKPSFAYLVQVKNLVLQSFQLCLLVCFDRTSFSVPNEHFFQKFESSLEVQRSKTEFSDNCGHNILELYNILVQVQFTTCKTKLYIQYSKLGIRAASRVVEEFKTQDLRKLENVRKISSFGEDKAQCPVSVLWTVLW